MRIPGLGRGRLLACVAAGLLLGACGQGGGGADISRRGEVRRRLVEADVDDTTRIARIAEEARPGNLAAVFPLIRCMKDRSHVAFLLVEGSGPGSGYQPVEFKGDPEFEPLVRVMAVCALERIGSPVALPDLLLALDDRSPWVANHAARALVRLGNRAGIPILLDNLEKKARSNEVANRLLEQITGQDFGFGPDIGYAARQEAIERWRDWYQDFEESGERLPLEGRPYRKGTDPEADRRIRYHVDMLGQFQFSYHGQARTMLRRLGEPGLAFLREGVDRARRRGNPQLRAAICQVLESIDHPNSRNLLLDLLGDSHATVRSRAARTLGRLGGREMGRRLAEHLDDPDPTVRLAVVRALGDLGGKQALEALSKVSEGDMPDLGVEVTVARFRASESRVAREEVLELLVEGELAARNAAHEALVELTGEDLGYEAVGPREEREKAARAYAKLLEP